MRTETVSSYSYSVWSNPAGVAETPAEYVFHRPRLYLETTIPSYLTARTSRDLETARRQRITLDWWNSWHTQFDIYISEFVSEEAASGDSDAAGRRAQFLAGLVNLDVNEHVLDLRDRLMNTCELPDRAYIDAAHIAVSSFHAIDFLLTWNCRHIANPAFFSKLSVVCESEGYTLPTLCTPVQLIERYEHGRMGI